MLRVAGPHRHVLGRGVHPQGRGVGLVGATPPQVWGGVEHRDRLGNFVALAQSVEQAYGGGAASDDADSRRKQHSSEPRSMARMMSVLLPRENRSEQARKEMR
ncbi:hypothetical protein BN2537_15169 [Streptomyces venezuelae]|nr:hypothetical protein BN2537_15169 [Streptomyces venezuelae]